VTDTGTVLCNTHSSLRNDFSFTTGEWLGWLFFVTIGWYLECCLNVRIPRFSSAFLEPPINQPTIPVLNIPSCRRCEQQKRRKMSQHTANNNSNCFNNTNTINVWNNSTVADDRSQLLSWLSPLEPKLRHRDVQERRVNNVGEWLIQSEEFRRWCGVSGESKGDNRVLFCYGHPGVGKTFLR